MLAAAAAGAGAGAGALDSEQSNNPVFREGFSGLLGGWCLLDALRLCTSSTQSLVKSRGAKGTCESRCYTITVNVRLFSWRFLLAREPLTTRGSYILTCTAHTHPSHSACRTLLPLDAPLPHHALKKQEPQG